jgi:hypothetical protein
LLEGERVSGPTTRAKELWSSIKPRLPHIWADVTSYAIAWSHSEGRLPLVGSDLSLNALVVCPDAPFEGGELVFHFSSASDPDGSYLVPLKENYPCSWSATRRPPDAEIATRSARHFFVTVTLLTP